VRQVDVTPEAVLEVVKEGRGGLVEPARRAVVADAAGKWPSYGL
jgi:hypothetical protein